MADANGLGLTRSSPSRPTGFTAEAERFAEEERVHLRTVSSIQDLEADFRVQGIVMHHAFVSSIDSVDVRTADPSDKRAMRIDSTARVRPVGTAEWKLFGRLLQDVAPFTTLGSEDGVYPRTFNRFYLTEAPMEIQAGEGVVEVTRLRVRYQLTIEKTESRAVAARSYAEGDRVIGREGYFDLPMVDRVERVRVQLLPKGDGTEDVRIVPELSPNARIEQVKLFAWRSRGDYERRTGQREIAPDPARP